MGMTSSKFKPDFQSGGLLWQMVIVVSFARGCKIPANDSKPYQTEWENIINEKWLI